MRLNVTLYRVMAYVTGVVLIILCVLAIAQIWANDGAAVNAVGTVPVMTFVVEHRIRRRYIEPALAQLDASPAQQDPRPVP